MIKLTERFFEEVYEESKLQGSRLYEQLNDAYQKQHLTELLASKLVDTIEKDARGCEEKGPDTWNYLTMLRNYYRSEHAKLEDVGGNFYRREFYGKKNSPNDKLIPPVEFLTIVLDKLVEDGLGTEAIQKSLTKWFGNDNGNGLSEMDLGVIKRAIEEIKAHGTSAGTWDKELVNSLNKEKLVAQKDGKCNMCYFDKGYDTKEKKPIR